MTLARILHILAMRPTEQSKLREQIIQTGARGGELDYDDLMALPYLDAVVRETLRL